MGENMDENVSEKSSYNKSYSNRDVAVFLKEIALFKDLNNENPFKVRAFENAARRVERLDKPVAKLIESGELFSLKGIGKQIGNVITEIVGSGVSSELEELKKKFPPSITELLSIPGMGAKKVKAVWEKLGIATIGELEYACLENRLVTLDGFGSKTQEKILRGIDFIRRNATKRLLPEAIRIADGIVKSLIDDDRISRVSIAGSLRRGKAVFKDIDILVVPKTGVGREQIKGLLLGFADKESDTGIIGAGETKVSIRVSGMQVDFRIVEEFSYPSALQHFTGSKEHNALLRSRAKKLGFKMNEYGIFRSGAMEEKIPVTSETEVYKALGLSWIPPEVREGFEEVERAENNSIPKLVEDRDIRGVVHIHSTYSDGANSIEELVGYCMDNGYEYLCISDHSKAAFYANGLKEEDLIAQKEEIDSLNERFSPFRIFWGIEADILPDGNLDYDDNILKGFDFVIASIHSKLEMDFDEATERLLKAVSNPYTTILGHPSGRLLLSREGYSFDWDTILTAMGENGVVLELNSNPHRLDPDWPILKRAADMGILISINPDAHSIEGINDMHYGVLMARKAWLTKDMILNCKSRGEIDEFFRKKRNR